jgi:hypothetical protein
MPLIPFDEVSRRLALSRRTYLGLQEIAVDRIVGSVDRSADFRRDFKPQRRLSRSRLASLREAFPDGVMFLRVYKIRRDLRGQDAATDFDAAATHARGVKPHERSKRQTRREGNRPLPQRPPRQGS